jgi:geranylgeranylglycerol-phosphate geranylgeranyltransferase
VRKLNSYFQITRPSNVALFFLSIWLGGLLVGGLAAAANASVLLAALSGTLIGAAGNVMNDVFDVDIDKINKPKRPLVSGELSVSEARRFAIGLAATGILISFSLSALNSVIAILTVIALYWYDAKFKRTLLIGNILVSVIASLGIVYGGVAVGQARDVWFPAAFSVLLNFGREVLKDFEDVTGDKAGGAETIPIRYGAKPTLVLVSLAFALLVAFSVVPFALGIYTLTYLIGVGLCTDSILIYTIFSAWQRHDKENLYRLNTLLKVAMLTGILSIAVGKP